MIDAAVIAFASPDGHRVLVACRPDTTDAMTAEACLPADEYGLRGRAFSGVALDVGAHIGAVTLALLADHPDLTVVAVEPLPENLALLRQNLALNGFADRAVVLEGAVGAERIFYGRSDSPFAHQHRYIGNADWQDEAQSVEAQVYSLADLRSFGAVALCKIDCEGGEWGFLDSPAVGDVAEFVGEFHTRGANGAQRLHELLDATHEVRVDLSQHSGPFRAVRRSA